jgi:hypothetical protein
MRSYGEDWLGQDCAEQPAGQALAVA